MIIGICGKMNSGKGVVATYLEGEYKLLNAALADPIKVIARVLFDISQEALWGPSENRRGNVRSILQGLGSWARTVDADVWTNLLVKSIKENRIAIQGVVIPDIRFPNEARILRDKLDAKIIKIVRPDNYTGIPDEQKLHESETSVDQIPEEFIYRTIVNEGGPEDLLHKIKDIMEELIHESSNADVGN